VIIKKLIQQFELDNRDLHCQQFLVAKVGDEVFGFGRLRKRNYCIELCSLGVVDEERLKGVGTQLVQSLIQKADEALYLVCIIPTFFEPFGFRIVDDFPYDMQEKLNYCTSELLVPEDYVVMKYKGNDV